MRDYVDEVLSAESTLIGRVKWFDGTRGYGFVVAVGIDEEVLLRQHVLNKINRSSIAEGSIVEFVGEHLESGWRVASIRSIKAPVECFLQTSNATAQRFPARVKWFNSKKGYGFVNCHGSDEDLFVGAQTLRSSGLSMLLNGEAVSVEIQEDDGQRRVSRIHSWSQ